MNCGNKKCKVYNDNGDSLDNCTSESDVSVIDCGDSVTERFYDKFMANDALLVELTEIINQLYITEEPEKDNRYNHGVKVGWNDALGRIKRDIAVTST